MQHVASSRDDRSRQGRGSKLLLLSEVFPPQTGGSGRWLWEVYRRFPRELVHFAVGETPGHDEFDRQNQLSATRLGLSLPTWGVLRKDGFLSYAHLFGRVGRLVRDHHIDSIHCGKVLPEGFLSYLTKLVRGTPYITFVHGEELNVATSSRELKWMTRRALRSARLVIANSQNTATLLHRDWGVAETNLQVLHPGVDIEFFRPAETSATARQVLGWTDRTVILTVGRLQIRKGHDQLIRALELIRRDVPNVLYAIVGDGEELEELQALVSQLGLEDFVQFRTSAADDELLSCYQQCDLFVLPNRTVDGDFEGFGMVLVEAQACGKAVVAGCSGGTRETMQVGKTGLITDCNDVQALATEIVALLQHPRKLDEMGQHARDWVVRNFSWHELCRRAEELFFGGQHAPSCANDAPPESTRRAMTDEQTGIPIA